MIAQAAVLLAMVPLLLADGAEPVVQDPPGLPFETVEVFSRLLHDAGLRPIGEEELNAATEMPSPEHTVLVIFGDLDQELWRIFYPEGLKGFREAGGNLLIASDYRDDDRLARLHPRGLRITGNRIDEPTRIYKVRDCPFLPLDALPRAHPLFLGLKRGIATNRPSAFQVEADETLEVLAEAAYRARDWNDWLVRRVSRAQTYPQILATPQAEDPRGRMLLLAGHGAFTNGMMLQADNEYDNFHFARNAIDWLKRSPSGQPRTRVLFIVEGRVVDRLNASLTPLGGLTPRLPVPTVATVNRLIHGLQQENDLNTLLFGSDRKRAVAAVVILLTCGLLFYTAKKLFDLRYRLTTAVPLLVGPYAQADATPDRLTQRHRALLASGNLWEAARSLAREWFQQELALPAGAAAGGRMPDVRASGSFFERWRLQAQAAALWQLAYGAGPVRVSAGQLAALTRQLPQLRQALRDGRLQFVGCTPTENS